jgi:hypothetical protein
MGEFRGTSPVHNRAGPRASDMGPVKRMREQARIITVKRASAKGELPPEVSLIPGGPLDATPLRDAVWAVARDMAAGGNAFPHIHAVLRGDPPRLVGWAAGSPIIDMADCDDPA